MKWDFGITRRFVEEIHKLARSIPFAPWRGVYRKPPKSRNRRKFNGSLLIADRSSSIAKLQRAHRKGHITFREPMLRELARHGWFRRQELKRLSLATDGT